MPRPTRLPVYVALALAVALGVTLTGCGSSGEDQAPAQSAPSVSTPAQGDEGLADEAPEPEGLPPATGDITMPARFGQQVDVADWAVSVDSIDTNATEEAKAAALEDYGDLQYYVAPANEYVAVVVTATYRGAQPSDTLTALQVQLYGSDKRVYTEVFGNQVPGQQSEQPALQPGGTATGKWVFDIPAAAAEGAYVSVQTTYGFDEVPEFFWTADGTAPA